MSSDRNQLSQIWTKCIMPNLFFSPEKFVKDMNKIKSVPDYYKLILCSFLAPITH
jgi:hypothetical protein